MSIRENFGRPEGLAGRLMLTGMNISHTPMARWGLTRFAVPKNGRIADIGCGGGYNVRRLLKCSGNSIVYGVDPAEASVKKSGKVNRRELGKRCRIVRAGAEKLPFKDDILDLATAFETVCFWQDIETCFREIRRVLKTGGQFAVVNDFGDPEKHWEDKIPGMKAYTAEDMAYLMEKTGFADIRISCYGFIYCVTGRA